MPTTNEFVLEAHGSQVVQRISTENGNNGAFEGLSMVVMIPGMVMVMVRQIRTSSTS